MFSVSESLRDTSFGTCRDPKGAYVFVPRDPYGPDQFPFFLYNASATSFLHHSEKHRKTRPAKPLAEQSLELRNREPMHSRAEDQLPIW